MMSNSKIKTELEDCRRLIENKLNEFFIDETKSYAGLHEAIRYSLLAGGKRIRAVLCIKFCEASGGNPEDALNAACAIEMLHAYSLIHDDLPCMDNSHMRRGKPTNHIKYNEFIAILSGDALQAAAFETLLSSSLPPENIVEMGKILAEAAGTSGICGGQYLDLYGETKKLSTEELNEIHSLKTSALISAAIRIGVVAASGTSGQLSAAERYAKSIGLAFQVRDDVLDMTASAEDLGKPVGSDLLNEKTTFATLLGIDACEDIIQIETEKAIKSIKDEFCNTDFLVSFANDLAKRET